MSVMNGVLASLAEAKEISYWKPAPPRPRPENPLMPGDGGKPAETVDYDGQDSPFESVKALGKDKLKSRYELSKARNEEASKT